MYSLVEWLLTIWQISTSNAQMKHTKNHKRMVMCAMLPWGLITGLFFFFSFFEQNIFFSHEFSGLVLIKCHFPFYPPVHLLFIFLSFCRVWIKYSDLEGLWVKVGGKSMLRTGSSCRNQVHFGVVQEEEWGKFVLISCCIRPNSFLS